MSDDLKFMILASYSVLVTATLGVLACFESKALEKSIETGTKITTGEYIRTNLQKFFRKKERNK